MRPLAWPRETSEQISGFVAHRLCDGQARQRHAQAVPRGLVHLALDHGHLRMGYSLAYAASLENLHDGLTLAAQIKQSNTLGHRRQANDGHRGPGLPRFGQKTRTGRSHSPWEVQVAHPRQKMRQKTRLKRRQAIEPLIGNEKTDHRMERRWQKKGGRRRSARRVVRVWLQHPLIAAVHRPTGPAGPSIGPLRLDHVCRQQTEQPREAVRKTNAASKKTADSR